MRIINTWRDPYDAGFSITRNKQITLKPGVTVLVGCNGAGKTTLLNNIESELKKANIPCHKFNNLSDGGSSSLGYILSGLSDESLEDATALICSSEGESIKYNISLQSKKYKQFLSTGVYNDFSNRLSRAFGKDSKEINTNERWLLYDATDSGVSIDSIIEIKSLFNLILKDAEEANIDLYIIITANEYELARNSECFDVNNNKYIRFSDYEDYRSFILNSRAKKEKRLIHQAELQEKRRIKKDAKIKEFEEEIKAIEDKAAKENRKLTRQEEYHIDSIKYKIREI